jgi:hypothetical protein
MKQAVGLRLINRTLTQGSSRFAPLRWAGMNQAVGLRSSRPNQIFSMTAAEDVGNDKA